MTRRRRNTPKQQARTELAGEAQKTDDFPSPCTPTTQYQHFIPRFILRRFQVGPVRSKIERQREFRRTGVNPEYVHYYDIATGSLDIRPIGKVYGVPNVYQDIRNTHNINELEEKLADLERHAASIIMDLHKALPQGTFTLKRRSLELLRKFLFIMHYRNVSYSGTYFQADHPENAGGRQWIEAFMKAKGIQSAVETWLHFLRYYLDTSHSDIMRDAAELVEKYGEEGLQKMMTDSHIPPDLEHFPAYTYHGHANSYFFSIWEAAEGEEFIITHNAFGLWEGLGGGCPGLHRIFVVSPRIALVLRHVITRPEMKEYIKPGAFVSSLLNVNPAPPTPIYASGKHGTHINHVNFQSAMSLARYRSSQEGGNDSFVFKITKLSRPQTLEFNSVVLVNVRKTGSLTFLSRRSMLRTARAFRSLPANFLASELLVPLIAQLTNTMETEVPALRPPIQSPATVLDQDVDALTLVDVVLYVLLMQICTGSRWFETAYDRAHLVFRIMEKAKPTSFADEISREVEKAFKVCKDSEDEMPVGEGISFASLLPSISNESSPQLFQFMIPCMSGLGAVMSGGEGILEELQDEVAVVSFLSRASSSPAVWHALSCTSPQAPEILSRLFKKGTGADGFVVDFTRFTYERTSPSDFSSGFHMAYSLRGVCGMTGPTTNPISQSYYRLTASMIQCLGRTMLGSLPEPYSSQPRERPKARLHYKMPEEHSKLLFSNMKMILRKSLPGYEPSPGGDTLTHTLRKWIDEMAIVGCLSWLGKHRRNYLDFILDGFPQGMNFKLFEDEEATGST
ncbi:hypothetical protein DFJ58DRAFT_732445 [Suillus subalutaceus]|uniref:uncharacterized protein n=1 Tax=Suillus subalutaceus TaxID=48586 RepID=UPI001B87D91F|nr:uncharacterized protein DFJ58DRAFT_732445 [Suillus subalutaceus]KAG1841435.1 hypothetical protein DFJ58DRAFT_732445 [Suillus subalutaceus]